MKVGIYTESLSNYIETIAYLISLSPIHQVVVITNLSKSIANPHPWSLKRLEEYKAKNVVIVSLHSDVQQLDVLYIECSSKQKVHRPNLHKWQSKANRISIFSKIVPKSGLKRAIKDTSSELINYFPYNFLAESVGFTSNCLLQNLYFYIGNKFHLSPHVHPKFLLSEKLRDNMFCLPNTDSERMLKFLFLGNRNPLVRKDTLKQVKASFKDISGFAYHNKYPIEVQDNSLDQVLWIEYGDKGAKRGLSSLEYISALSKSKFCICPLGWAGWTHRVVESLIRGAIPILEDPRNYHIGLSDMENCVVASPGKWDEAIRRAHELSEGEIYTIRYNITELVEQYLMPKNAGNRLRKQMSLE